MTVQRARLLALVEELTGEDNYGDLSIRSAPSPMCADWAQDVRDVVAALDQVRAIHAPIHRLGPSGPIECNHCGKDYPCPTIRAIEGEDV